MISICKDTVITIDNLRISFSCFPHKQHTHQAKLRTTMIKTNRSNPTVTTSTMMKITMANPLKIMVMTTPAIRNAQRSIIASVDRTVLHVLHKADTTSLGCPSTNQLQTCHYQLSNQALQGHSTGYMTWHARNHTFTAIPWRGLSCSDGLIDSSTVPSLEDSVD